LAISSFKKGQILKNEKGQISFKQYVKITRFKIRISKNITCLVQISPIQALKYTIFFNIQKDQKGPNDQFMFFWQNVFKKA